MSHYIELHCHVLPNLDDGPQTPAQAAELVAALSRLGFSEIHPTPHQKAQSWAPTREACFAARGLLQSHLDEPLSRRVTIADPAGENMWDDLFLSRQHDTSFPFYQGGNAFLIEFNTEHLPSKLNDTLFRFQMQKWLPVIAHVERYGELVASENKIAALSEQAALLVNLSALGGMTGFFSKRAARKLVETGYVHALSTDTHSLEDLRYSEEGLAWAERALGSATMQRLLIDNPRKILSGILPG